MADSPFKLDSRKKAFLNVIRATHHFQGNDHISGNKSVVEAKNHAESHVRELKSQDKHEEASKFIEDFSQILEKLNAIKERNKIKPFSKSESASVNYKEFHQLEPMDQKRVSQWFGKKDMHLHIYPVHHETGKPIHAPRKIKKAEEKEG